MKLGYSSHTYKRHFSLPLRCVVDIKKAAEQRRLTFIMWIDNRCVGLHLSGCSEVHKGWKINARRLFSTLIRAHREKQRMEKNAWKPKVAPGASFDKLNRILWLFNHLLSRGEKNRLTL